MSEISNFLGGSSKSTNSSGNQDTTTAQTSNTTQNQNVTQNQSTTNQQSQTGNQIQNVSTLDDATQQLLKSIIGQVGNGTAPLNDAVTQASSGAGATATNLMSLFGNPAVNTNQVVNNAVDAAKLGYENGEGNQIEQMQQFTGSNDNSASKLLAERGATDEATTLGNVATQAGLQGETANSTLGLNALQGLGSLVSSSSANSASLANLINVLKGATTTGTTTDTQNLTGGTTANETSSLASTLNSIINGTSNTNASSTSTTNNTPSLLATIGGLLSLGNGSGS